MIISYFLRHFYCDCVSVCDIIMIQCEDVCHRFLAISVGLGLTITVFILGTIVYRPNGDYFIALYSALCIVTLFQAIALQIHRCFDVHKAWTGALSVALLGGYAMTTALLWVRFFYECSVHDCYRNQIFDKSTLLQDHDVRIAAQFTSAVSILASIACIGRWISVCTVRHARRERRAAAAMTVRPRRSSNTPHHIPEIDDDDDETQKTEETDDDDDDV